MAEPASEILTNEELAAYLKIAKSTLYKLVRGVLCLARSSESTGASTRTRSIHGSSNSPARRSRLEGDEISMAKLFGFQGTTITEKCHQWAAQPNKQVGWIASSLTATGERVNPPSSHKHK